ncbi:hypothetical protein [Curtobacterium sp. ISL-83]|nr:hypothetical protein [Curtobacterium sp. ISL-83]
MQSTRAEPKQADVQLDGQAPDEEVMKLASLIIREDAELLRRLA